jgi:hypothetical protein
MPLDICHAIAASDKLTITPAEDETFVKELMEERKSYTNDGMPRLEYVNLWYVLPSPPFWKVMVKLEGLGKLMTLLLSSEH